MNTDNKKISHSSAIAFLCFVLSGAASVSYEMIWLRQAMTYFGVVSPVLSAVISVFMAGLAFGTWFSGRITSSVSPKNAIKYYALVELLIAGYAFIVPMCFKMGYNELLSVSDVQSGTYLLASWGIITVVLLPVSILIGCTLPLLMHYLRGDGTQKNNFGFLYYANLLGGVLGCILPLIIIELYGFAFSTYIVMGLNVVVGVLAITAYTIFSQSIHEITVAERVADNNSREGIPAFTAITLFMFGFTAMGSEVLWIRAYMPVIGPTVYSFATVLAVYLLSNALGTHYYLSKKMPPEYSLKSNVTLLFAVSALLPALVSSTALMPTVFLPVAAVAIVSFCYGYLTPVLVDQFSQGNARKASTAYLYNCLGCIVGPIFSTYVLFFLFGIKGSLIFYAVIILILSLKYLDTKQRCMQAIFCFCLVMLPTLYSTGYEDIFLENGTLQRDNVGYIGGLPAKDPHMIPDNKVLYVNGIGMTMKTTITKLMAHLPMTHHANPKSALVICFGEGTTVRSLLSWPVEEVVAVELSKGVVESFKYFHEDAEKVLLDPRLKIIIDDGRRYLNRTSKKYDVITIDPPPPVSASGSGLLYTDEFLSLVKKRMTPSGIFQHWVFIPSGVEDRVHVNAVVNAIKRKFKHIKFYRAITEGMGFHILASDSPLPEMSQELFVSRLKGNAKQDLAEWENNLPIEKIAEKSLHSIDEKHTIIPELNDIYMSDDRLYNEFFAVRILTNNAITQTQ